MNKKWTFRRNFKFFSKDFGKFVGINVVSLGEMCIRDSIRTVVKSASYKSKKKYYVEIV